MIWKGSPCRHMFYLSFENNLCRDYITGGFLPVAACDKLERMEPLCSDHACGRLRPGPCMGSAPCNLACLHGHAPSPCKPLACKRREGMEERAGQPGHPRGEGRGECGGLCACPAPRCVPSRKCRRDKDLEQGPKKPVCLTLQCARCVSYAVPLTVPLLSPLNSTHTCDAGSYIDTRDFAHPADLAAHLK